MTRDSGSNDDEKSSVGGEIPSDALGDTQLGRSLKELIKEIGKEKDALQKGLGDREASGSESQNGDDFDPSITHFDQTLDLVARTQEGSENAEKGAASAGGPASAPGNSETRPPFVTWFITAVMSRPAPL